MQYNDTTNKTGILQECESWLFDNNYGAITGNTNLLATFTRYANIAMDETLVYAMQYDRKWQFDDSNQTDYPIATTDLVVGQQDYTLDVTHIKITGVEILGADGKYYPLKQKDIRDINDYGDGVALSQFEPTNGKPIYYDPTSTGLFLYPAPASGSVTTTAGLKIYYQRPPTTFSTNDTTKVPGIPSVFHTMIPIKMSLRYAKTKSMSDKARELEVEEAKLMASWAKHLSSRNDGIRPRLTTKIESTR